jgi:diguanylate cyclase (GGDEF)-like protein
MSTPIREAGSQTYCPPVAAGQTAEPTPQPPTEQQTAPSRRVSIRAQAGRRLAVLMLVLSTGILYLGYDSHQTRLKREVVQKLATLEQFYAGALPAADTAWQADLMRLRQRIEFFRMLEPKPGEADSVRWARLTSFLTAQTEFSAFPNLLILDSKGDIRFRYGQEALSATPTSAWLNTLWHFNADRSEAWRVLSTAIWLGEEGEGRLLVLKPLNNSVLKGLAAPEVRLTARVNNQYVAESHSRQAVQRSTTDNTAGLIETPEGAYLQQVTRWPGPPEANQPSLIVQQAFRDSFPLGEFMLRPLAAMALILLLLYIGMGSWLRTTIGRLEAITATLRAYRIHGRTPPTVDTLLPQAAIRDEVSEVSTALLDMMRSVDARSEEQKSHLDTLSLLDEAVIELNCDATIRLASTGWNRLTRSDEDPVGHPFSSFIHEDDVDSFSLMCSAFKSREKDQSHTRLRLRNEMGDGDIWVECRFVTLTDDDGNLLGGRGVLHDITQTYLHEQQISHMALHDALTNLPNRILLEDRIKVALRMAHRNGHKAAVCFIDLDHFKNINDSLGHKAGDRLLLAFTSRVQHLLREGDTLARWGGDEFVLLLPNMTDIEDVRDVLGKVHAAFKQPIKLDETDFVLTFSIGAALYPDDGQSTETLLSQADRAMFYAKSQGRNQACLFGEIAANSSSRHDIHLQNKLAEAITQARIEAWYQPLIDAQSGRCVGAEVLARWKDDTQCWISPATFIPMAESLGLIRDLGEQIWLQALDALQTWRTQGQRLHLAVNISKRQLFSPYLTEQLLAQLEQRGLSPEDVVLEVTESVAVHDAAHTIEQLHALDRAGFRIAVDDFGTGYSSLSQLHELPVDELKIDISFVRRIHEPSGRSMVEAILHLSRALNLKTVAEGVENELTANVLSDLGANMLQGYHFAKPMPRDEFTHWLSMHASASSH